MKKLMIFLAFLVGSLISCNKEKDNDEHINFYNLEYRKGLWISADKKDTLDFVDHSHLIRKGYFYSFEEYMYRIEDQTIFIKLPETTAETQHPIIRVDKDIIVIGNMYLTIGFQDNSGTFIKERIK